METELKETNKYKDVCSSQLLQHIALKDEFPVEAKQAFTEFCYRFEKEVIRRSEIYSSKFNYTEVVALEIAQCTFARVWKYPTFDINKAKGNDVDKAVLLWLNRILYTQLIKYGKEQFCAEPSEEEDLSIITDVDRLIDLKSSSDDPHQVRMFRQRLEVLNKAFIGLSEKHKIIYLTYKAYEIQGKNIPRTITKKLQDTLELTQASIRVYKKEANLHVINYIEKINGGK